jgi:hypothetical protein
MSSKPLNTCGVIQDVRGGCGKANRIQGNRGVIVSAGVETPIPTTIGSV